MGDPMKHHKKQKTPKDGKNLLWDTLCGEEVSVVDEFLAWAAQALGVGHWNVYISAEPALTKALASIEVLDLRYTAAVSVTIDWVARGYEEQAMALFHEVVHITHTRVQEVVDEELYDLLPEKFVLICDTLSNRYHREQERMVDALVVALCEALGATEVWNQMRRDLGLPAGDETSIPLVPASGPKLRAAVADRK